MGLTKIRGNRQILDGSIENAQISASAAIDFSKLAALTDGNFLVGNGSNVATSVAPSGDVTFDNTGAFSIAAGVITNADINASAAIQLSKLEAVTSGNIIIGNVSNVPTSVDLTSVGDIEASATGGLTYKAGSIVDADINASAAISLSKLAEAVIQADGGQAFTANQSMGSNRLTDLAAPVSGTDAANKTYVDGVASGLDVKNSVRVATTAALPANTPAGTGVGKTLTANAVGILTVDGVATVLGDRILVKDEASGQHNGIYEVTTEGTAGVAFVLTRATDADQDAEVTAGLFTFVEEGTANADSGWTLTTDDPITVDTTVLSFSQFSGAGSITAGSGLSKSGNTLNVGDVNRGVQVNADDLEIDGSEMVAAAGGLQENGTNSWQIEIKPDVTTGATVAPLATGANGAGVTVDNSTVTHSGGTLSVGTVAISNISDIVSATEAAGHILVRDAANDSYDNVAVSGDATLASTGVLTLASNVLKEADIVTREVPTGTINGVNDTFTLANTPVAGTEHVYLNGVLQNEGASNDYTISGATITFASGSLPQTGDVVLVSYWK